MLLIFFNSLVCEVVDVNLIKFNNLNLFKRMVCEYVDNKFLVLVWLVVVVNFCLWFLISCKNLLLGDFDIFLVFCLLLWGFSELLEIDNVFGFWYLLFSYFFKGVWECFFFLGGVFFEIFWWCVWIFFLILFLGLLLGEFLLMFWILNKLKFD